MKPRKEAVQKLYVLLDKGVDIKIDGAWHFGRCELDAFLDWLYGKPAKNDNERVIRQLDKKGRYSDD